MGSGLKFSPYDGDLMGLACDENYLIFRWNGEGKILGAVSRRGNAASCHFSADRKGLRHLKQAINEFVDFCYYMFDWCTMMMGFISIDSVERVVKKCGFIELEKLQDCTVYVRLKDE